MLYIPKIDDYLKISTGDKVKNYVTIGFSEYFKSGREKMYFKPNIFLTTPDEVEK